jgi:hypothetical protein
LIDFAKLFMFSSKYVKQQQPTTTNNTIPTTTTTNNNNNKQRQHNTHTHTHTHTHTQHLYIGDDTIYELSKQVIRRGVNDVCNCDEGTGILSYFGSLEEKVVFRLIKVCFKFVFSLLF